MNIQNHGTDMDTKTSVPGKKAQVLTHICILANWILGATYCVNSRYQI